MKIGVICPSEIALRRFMPALKQIPDLEFVGIGVYTPEERFENNLPSNEVVQEVIGSNRAKAQAFIDQYGGKIFEGYRTIVESDEIEAIYIPLPPALHYKWAKLALESGKHVLVEKPSTISALYTRDLVKNAENRQLVLHENYMFTFHQQLEAINDIVKRGEIGEVRLYKISFGFPRRSANDFRYHKTLGGGALIDAGGYTIKYATMLLGETAKLRYAQMNYSDEFEVDMFGSGALVNESGVTAQIAFGMDNSYKCELEIWGSQGYLSTGRVLTAPVGFTPSLTIKKGNDLETRSLPADDSFKKSIQHFVKCVGDDSSRITNYASLIKQAELVDEFRRLAEKIN